MEGSESAAIMTFLSLWTNQDKYERHDHVLQGSEGWGRHSSPSQNCPSGSHQLATPLTILWIKKLPLRIVFKLCFSPQAVWEVYMTYVSVPLLWTPWRGPAPFYLFWGFAREIEKGGFPVLFTAHEHLKPSWVQPISLIFGSYISVNLIWLIFFTSNSALFLDREYC